MQNGCESYATTLSASKQFAADVCFSVPQSGPTLPAISNGALASGWRAEISQGCMSSKTYLNVFTVRHERNGTDQQSSKQERNGILAQGFKNRFER